MYHKISNTTFPQHHCAQTEPWIRPWEVIPCEVDQISEKFPPHPYGFCWNLVRAMYPSINENPENFIVYSWMVPKLQPPNYGPLSLDIESFQFMVFWNCSYSASFNSKHLKFWIVTHFLQAFTTKNIFI